MSIGVGPVQRLSFDRQGSCLFYLVLAESGIYQQLLIGNQLILKMESHKLLNEKASSIKPYECPTMETLYVDTQSVICASETEKVEETDGEW